MKAGQEIDNLIAQNQDWRGFTLAKLRKIILGVDPEITEEWKWMGSPVWSRSGAICVGNIFKNRVKLVFADGAALDDPDKIFNAGLAGNRWRAIDFSEGDNINEKALQSLVRAAINYNLAKTKK
ncbi:MAG: DUF1801 domain-containing protein [Candidatus Berkelbacteria bacterium]|nr:DUF1801 domain-containing protein [Candidatus Berkelbacteria bacterium]